MFCLQVKDSARRAVARAGFAEAGDHALQLRFYVGAAFEVVEEVFGGAVDIFRVGLGLDELGVDLLVGEEIRHGQIFYSDESAAEKVGAPGGAIDHDGGDFEVSTFHGDSAGGGDGGGGGGECFGEIADLDL